MFLRTPISLPSHQHCALWWGCSHSSLWFIFIIPNFCCCLGPILRHLYLLPLCGSLFSLWYLLMNYSVLNFNLVKMISLFYISFLSCFKGSFHFLRSWRYSVLPSLLYYFAIHTSFSRPFESDFCVSCEFLFFFFFPCGYPVVPAQFTGRTSLYPHLYHSSRVHLS